MARIGSGSASGYFWMKVMVSFAPGRREVIHQDVDNYYSHLLGLGGETLGVDLRAETRFSPP